MEVTGVLVRLLMHVLVLLSALNHISSHVHNVEAAFPRVVPSRLQLFEYEPLSVNCEGLAHDLIKWRVMRIILGSKTICNNKWEITGSCNITTAFTVDSGEYWCEAEGKKTNSVSITVTAGDVVLESPARPVTEGEDVTLRCRKRRASTTEAEFYKDDLLIWSSSTGQMTIHNISKSDEGLYRCSISGVGGSAGSRLVVRARVILESPALPVLEGDDVTLSCRTKISSSNFADFYKDGVLIRSSSTGTLTIQNVSKSDEGLYRCSISGAGDSAGSWLAVRALIGRGDEGEDIYPPPVQSHSSLIRILVTMLLVTVGVTAGLWHCKKKSVASNHLGLPALHALTPEDAVYKNRAAAAFNKPAVVDYQRADCVSLTLK